MAKIKKSELEHIMSYAIGTEQYWIRAVFGPVKILYTDGVKLFMEKTDSQWLVEEVLFKKPKMQKLSNEYLWVVKLEVEEGDCKIHFSDGNYRNNFTKKVKMTEIPDGEWTFFYDLYSNVMIWHGEY